MVRRACVGFIGLSAHVPCGTEGKGHLSLFVSASASPMLSGSLYEGGPNFKTLVINNHNPCLKDFPRLPKMCTHYLVASAFFHSSAHSTAGPDSALASMSRSGKAKNRRTSERIVRVSIGTGIGPLCPASECKVTCELLGMPMGAELNVSVQRDIRKRHTAKRASWIRRNERSAQGSLASGLPHRGARVKRCIRDG